MKRLYKFLGLSLLLVSCNMGNSGGSESNNVTLQGYIDRLSYIPVANNKVK